MILQFIVILIKIPMIFLTELEKKPKYYMKIQRACKANTILSRKNIAGGITTLDFKLYYRAIAIKIVLYWHKPNL